MSLTKNTVGVDKNNNYINLLLSMCNRHGFISGATGSGKTITLRKLAEIFSLNNIPVFLVDIKGDISGLMNSGNNVGIVAKRIQEFNLGKDYLQDFPVRFWDIFAEKGIPLKIAIQDLGPIFLSRLLGLNSTQEGVLNLAFKVVKDKQFNLVYLQDLRSLLQYLSENYKDYQDLYGNVSVSTIGAIQRQLLVVENEGGGIFFGKPSIDINDFFKQRNSKGVINVLNAEKLVNSPRVFSAFLLWMLVELFKILPEVGDLDKPKFVMFFDESHLLFDKAQSTLIKEIEQVVRLIRSKGVGIFFCTQNPLDIPSVVLGQLGNKIQHALRSFTLNEQKNVKAVAQTFRSDQKVDLLVEILGQLEVGEALISFLDEKGVPNIVQRAFILPPASQIQPISFNQEINFIKSDVLYDKYHQLNNKAESQNELFKHSNNEKLTNINDKSTDKSTKRVLDGFIGGLLGNRKNANSSFTYNLSNELGKSISRDLKKNAKNIISFVVNQVFRKNKK